MQTEKERNRFRYYKRYLITVGGVNLEKIREEKPNELKKLLASALGLQPNEVNMYCSLNMFARRGINLILPETISKSELIKGLQQAFPLNTVKESDVTDRREWYTLTTTGYFIIDRNKY